MWNWLRRPGWYIDLFIVAVYVGSGAVFGSQIGNIPPSWVIFPALILFGSSLGVMMGRSEDAAERRHNRQDTGTNGK